MASTLEAQKTVGELVAERPARSRVFESLSIDYCCGGKIPLSEACKKRGHDTQAVIALLEKSDADADRQATRELDPNTMGLAELADHIEQEHHAFLRKELPRLDVITEKVCRVHGEADPRLATVRKAYCALRDELSSHMLKEERILFPMIRSMERSPGQSASLIKSVADPIQQMEQEHQHAGDALATMRDATDGYTPPSWACNTYRAMLDGLAYLEADMHQHVHKENNVLFPKSIRLEHQIATDPVA